MLVAQQIETHFPAAVRLQGRQLFQAERVEQFSCEEGVAFAEVLDNSGEFYSVELRFQNDFSVGGWCNCGALPNNKTCRHLWAAVLETDRYFREGERQEAPEVRRLPAWEKQLLQVAQDYLDSAPPAHACEELKRHEALFAINVGASLKSDQLVIELFQRKRLKSGKFGQARQLSIHNGNVDKFSQQDGNLLELLVEQSAEEDDPWSYHYYRRDSRISEVTLGPEVFAYLLPQLSNSGRFFWMLNSGLSLDADAAPVQWDAAGPYQFRLRVSREKDKAWRLAGELLRGEEIVPLRDCVMLLGDGLVLFKNRLAQLDTTHFPWINRLQREGAIKVPADQSERLLKFLWQTPNVPEMALPEELTLPEVVAPPQPCLHVHAPEYSGARTLRSEVDFTYDDWEVPNHFRGANVVDHETKRLIRRDLAAESKHLGKLAELGLQEFHSSRERYFEFPASRLTEISVALLNAGWKVEAEGSNIRGGGVFSATVTSGIDWFELDGSLDFDGQVVKLPELLAAAKKGNRFVQLGDGTQGLLPDKWLEQWGALADLGHSKEGKLRFRPSQAMLLDALLAARGNVSYDETFAGIRQRLKTLNGVPAKKPPKSFQGTLRHYQEEGLGWMHFLQEFDLGGCLADDMGLGKTVQVLALLEARRNRQKNEQGLREPSLVVVPKSLVFNWMDEAARFTPKLKVLNYTGTDRKAFHDQLADYDLVITTYGTLRRDIAKLKDEQFDFAILDESQAIKNGQSQSAKACRLLQARHRLAMTGTPVENHIGELWSLFEFLNPGMLGNTTAFNKVAKNGSDEASAGLISKAIAPFILRRTKEQVLTELPEKNEQTLFCDLEGKQKKQYEELRKYYQASLTQTIEDKGLAQSKIHVLEALLRLRQAACHPGLIDPKRRADPSAKLEVLLEQVEEVISEGHKALIFSQFTSLLELVRVQMEKKKFTYEYLDGQTRNRKEKVDRFQNDPACQLFLISLKAGGHGLNLTAADYVFILDPWWNPAVEAQAVDRAHRMGQTRKVFAYRIIAKNTVEERILELQSKKRDLAEAVISGNDGGLLKNLSADDLALLLS